ncbi:long-chain-fatty-acid--protein ligase [Mongoliitalea daihaiensis]|uniref:acyl transferase n=1 Tax=Mongoliitalea daihaiensis TaxID=2782006 RepID=UPI001F167B29|nr:acyl transferase [Mongoliitalea daihaiensis]UJP63470.1 acyl transferase [Mongoliitalea daihaiensis]
MKYFKSFEADLINITEENFESLALRVFYFQALHNPVYKKYLFHRNISAQTIHTLEEIPFLPIQFFKDNKVYCLGEEQEEGFFSSSGTTGMITSKHYYWSKAFYLQHARRIFEKEYGALNKFHVLALLPAYLEREGSSLVAMAEDFILHSESSYSGFYLYDHDRLLDQLQLLAGTDKQVLLLGVTFALLDLAEKFEKIPQMNNLIVMETGGMKGRRKEMIREEVHDILKDAYKVKQIHSEYGMTELLSQAYSKGEGKYTLPPSMRILLRDINDPLSYTTRSTGGINVIDLANFHSCSFIETQDLGRFDEVGKLEVLGRFDNSETRGCNLMVN